MYLCQTIREESRPFVIKDVFFLIDSASALYARQLRMHNNNHYQGGDSGGDGGGDGI